MGWKSRYDSPRQSNTDKYFGRILHIQDNYWFVAKILIVIFVVVCIYVIKTEDLGNFSGLRSFLNYLR